MATQADEAMETAPGTVSVTHQSAPLPVAPPAEPASRFHHWGEGMALSDDIPQPQGTVCREMCKKKPTAYFVLLLSS